MTTGAFKDLGNVSGVVQLDASAFGAYACTLVGPTKFSVVGLSLAGTGRLVVKVTQDATGGRSLAWNGQGGQAVSSSDSGMLTPGSAANQSTTFEIVPSSADLSSVQIVAASPPGGVPIANVQDVASTSFVAISGAGQALVPSVGGGVPNLLTTATCTIPPASTWVGKTIVALLNGIASSVATPQGGDTIKNGSTTPATYTIQGASTLTSIGGNVILAYP